MRLSLTLYKMATSFPFTEALHYLTAKEVATVTVAVSKCLQALSLSLQLWTYLIDRDMGVDYRGKSAKPWIDYYHYYVKQHSLRILKPEHNLYGLYYPKNAYITWRPTSHRFPYDAVLCPLRSGHLLVVGGERYNRPSPDVFLLSEDTLQAAILSPMVTPRLSPGVIEVNTRVYVFGGIAYLHTIQSAEALDLATSLWQPIAPMLEGKAAVYPLRYKERIYLAGVQSRVLEEYRTDLDEYRVVLVLDNLFVHFAFEADERLVWMDSFGKFTYFNPRDCSAVTRVNKCTRAEMPLNTPLCRHQDYLYYASSERGILCVDRLSLETLQFKKLLTENWN